SRSLTGRSRRAAVCCPRIANALQHRRHDVSAGGWMLSELLRQPADSQFQKLVFTSDRCAVGRSQAAGPCQLPARSWPQHDKQTPEAVSHCWLKPIRWLVPGLEAGNESRRRTNQIEKPRDDHGKAPP